MKLRVILRILANTSCEQGAWEENISTALAEIKKLGVVGWRCSKTGGREAYCKTMNCVPKPDYCKPVLIIPMDKIEEVGK